MRGERLSRKAARGLPSFLAFGLCIALGASRAPSADWPCWGGDSSRNMVNEDEVGLPDRWDPRSGESIRWSAALGSQTYGNVVVAGGKVLVGTNNQAPREPEVAGDKGILMCFRESDGRFLWQAAHDKLASGSANDWPEVGICSTPWVEGDRLYYVSNRAELVCADLEGFLDGENDGPYKSERGTRSTSADFVWVLDMIDTLGVYPHNQATSSPLVVGDLVYVLTSNGVEEEDHKTVPAPEAPSFIAVDKRTGKVRWQTSEPGRAILHGQWSSPAYVPAGEQGQVVFPAGDGKLRGLDPLTGALLWTFDLNPPEATWRIDGGGDRGNLVATPVYADGLVYIGAGRDPEHGDGPGNLYAVSPNGRGIISDSGRVWRRGGDDFTRTLSSVAVHDGLVYAADLMGFLYCLDAKTGEQVWKDDLLAAVWGSPMYVDGKVYIGDEDGDIAVYRAGRTLEQIVEINMGSTVYGTPVAANGTLYIATRNKLFAIGKPDPAPGDTKPDPQAAAPPKDESASWIPKALEAPWASFRGDPALRGARTGKVSDSPRLRWTWDGGSPIESTAVIAGGSVYVGTQDGVVALVLEAKSNDGERRWASALDAGVRSAPLVQDGTCFVGDDVGVFHALDATTGKSRWRFDTESGSEIISSATMAGDRVLFGCYDAYLYCLEPKDGKLLWKYETQGQVHATPAVEADRTFVAGCDGQLRIIDVTSGSEVAALDLGSQTGASPAVLGDRLYVGTLGGQFLGVAWRKPEILWTYEDPDRQFPFYSSPAIGAVGKEQVVVFGGRDKGVHAVRTRDGTRLWSFATKAAVDGSPVVVGERVVVGGLDGNIYMLDLSTGKEIWRFLAGSDFVASPSVGEGALVISTEDGQVFCFTLKSS